MVRRSAGEDVAQPRATPLDEQRLGAAIGVRDAHVGRRRCLLLAPRVQQLVVPLDNVLALEASHRLGDVAPSQGLDRHRLCGTHVHVDLAVLLVGEVSKLRHQYRVVNLEGWQVARSDEARHIMAPVAQRRLWLVRARAAQPVDRARRECHGARREQARQGVRYRQASAVHIEKPHGELWKLAADRTR